MSVLTAGNSRRVEPQKRSRGSAIGGLAKNWEAVYTQPNALASNTSIDGAAKSQFDQGGVLEKEEAHEVTEAARAAKGGRKSEIKVRVCLWESIVANRSLRESVKSFSNLRQWLTSTRRSMRRSRQKRGLNGPIRTYLSPLIISKPGSKKSSLVSSTGVLLSLTHLAQTTTPISRMSLCKSGSDSLGTYRKPSNTKEKPSSK